MTLEDEPPTDRNSPPADIAIAHKDYDVKGGGEVLCERLAKALDCPLHVGRRDPANVSEDADLDIHEIPLSRADRWMIDRGGFLRTAAYALQWQAASEDLSDYDTLIMSGNEPLWYVPPDQQTVVAYTHSTPRFMYDLYNETRDFSGVRGRIRTLFNTGMRTVYESNVNRPDLWVANSDLVARRIERYWDVDKDQIRVVYPPVDTHNYSPNDAPTEDVYLYLGRLAGHKRVDGVIQAFDDLDAELVIAGDGPDRDRLEEMAGDNVDFRGYVPEAEKHDLFSRAKALIYPPLNEDFGMVPIEAMAAGTPVIGVRDGFTQFQIRDGENGLLYERGADNLATAVRRFELQGVSMDPEEIAAWAGDWFGVVRFEREMRAAIAEAREDSEVVPPWEETTPTEVSYAAPTK